VGSRGVRYENLAPVLAEVSGRDQLFWNAHTFHACGLHLWCFRFVGLTTYHSSPQRLVRC
jgi:hypothetical protein